MTAKRSSEIQMLHEAVTCSTAGLYPVNLLNDTAPFACSCPFQTFLKHVPRLTYIYAATTCIPVALSNFDLEQDESIDGDLYTVQFKGRPSN
jgi:hypothetical protein